MLRCDVVNSGQLLFGLSPRLGASVLFCSEPWLCMLGVSNTQGLFFPNKLFLC